MLEGIGWAIFSLIIYPGLLFSFIFGGLYDWVKRKIEARAQSRRGPPWYQSYADFFKLMFKEQIIPVTASRSSMMLAPLISLVALLLALLIIPFGFTKPPVSFMGDLIVLIYLLVVPSFTVMLAGSSSGSPYGSVGAGREVSLLLAKELPFVISILSPAIVVGSLNFSEIVSYQLSHTWFLVLNPFAAVALFICLIAKLSLRPFDISEAEQEIVAGWLTEYGGPLYGIFTLSKFAKWIVMGALFSSLFLGGGDGLPCPWNVLWFLVKITIFVIIMALIHAANARFRIDQAFKWYLTGILGLSIAGLILAIITKAIIIV